LSRFIIAASSAHRVQFSQISQLNRWKFPVAISCGAFRVATQCTIVYSTRGGGLGSRPKKMYGERLGDGVEYHLMKPTLRR